MIKRSREYYVWKLDKNPTKHFKYIVAKVEGRLSGFVVYNVRDDREVDIVDWFHAPNDNELVVMAKLVNELINEGIKINALMINAKSKEARLMERLGFWNASNKILRRKLSPLIIFIMNPSLECDLHVPKNWSLRYIDYDGII